MLPDWEFNGDKAKRAAFISWVWAELDRFAVLVSERDPTGDMDWAEVFASGAKARVGRPGSALDATNGMVWDYLLLRYMFARYWPGQRRADDDPANALNIAVSRNLALPPGSRTGDLQRLDLHHEARDKLVKELKRGVRSVSVGRGKPRVKSLGRIQAEADIATLDALPPNLFAR